MPLRNMEFTERWEVDRYLSTSGYLGDNVHPYFVALPKDRGTVSNEEFHRQIGQVDDNILHHLHEGVNGGFDEEKFKPFIGFGCLKEYLESELQKRYKESAPATLALLEQHCDEVTTDLARMESKIRATSDVAIFGDPSPEQWGKTTTEEQLESGIGSWPGVSTKVKPPNSTLKLYGGAAFERVMHEFRCATYSIECPPVSRKKVANILLAHAGRGGGGRVTEVAAEIARAAARLGSLPFWTLLDLVNQCKQLIRHHLDSVGSPYSQVCYERDLLGSYVQGGSSIYRFNQAQVSPFCIELSDDEENIPPERNAQQTTPGKSTTAKDAFRESQLTVPETPSPDQPCDIVFGVGKKKEQVNGNELGAKKRQSRMAANTRNLDHRRLHNDGENLFGNGDIGSRSGSAYSDICSTAAQYFSRIHEVLIDRSVPSTLNSAFLTPCRDKLVVALGIDLFAVNDEKFMDMFVAPSAISVLQNERQSLHKRQKVLQSCLYEFKNIARSL
ncbi:hypothetical protein MKX01_012139 [Papaver californicum]|nr:hypothetical protein MKX01_012139 [Papaver californicum]